MTVTWIFPPSVLALLFSLAERVSWILNLNLNLSVLVTVPETHEVIPHSKDREDTACCLSYKKEFMGLPWWSSSWEFACQCREHRRPGFDPQVGKIPGLGRSPGEGNGNPPQYSCLGHVMDRGAWQGSQGSQRVGQDWATQQTPNYLHSQEESKEWGEQRVVSLADTSPCTWKQGTSRFAL